MGELIVILLVILVLFGPTQLPKLARMLGKAISEFKKASQSEDESISDKITLETEEKKNENEVKEAEKNKKQSS